MVFILDLLLHAFLTKDGRRPLGHHDTRTGKIKVHIIIFPSIFVEYIPPHVVSRSNWKQKQKVVVLNKRLQSTQKFHFFTSPFSSQLSIWREHIYSVNSYYSCTYYNHILKTSLGYDWSEHRVPGPRSAEPAHQPHRPTANQGSQVRPFN